MKKVKNNMTVSKSFEKAIKEMLEKYYKAAISNNVERALAAKKMKLLCKSK